MYLLDTDVVSELARFDATGLYWLGSSACVTMNYFFPPLRWESCRQARSSREDKIQRRLRR